MSQPRKANQSVVAADCIRRIRDEMSRCDYYAALSSIRGLESSSNSSDEEADEGPSSPSLLNVTQRLRLCLLKADCYSALGTHVKALEAAKVAAELSHMLSPQAMFICGRECLKLGQLQESLVYFESGETLIRTGLGVSEGIAEQKGVTDVDSLESRRCAAWAAIGEDPRVAPKGFPPSTDLSAIASSSSNASSSFVTSDDMSAAPLEPSFEWAQDLKVWRQLHSEAKLLRVMQETHVVPGRLVHQAVAYASKQGGTRSHGVIVIRNATKEALKLQYDYLKNCEFIGGFTLAPHIAPGDVCVAVVCYTGWATGGVALAAYRNAVTGATAVFMLDAPLLTQYSAGGYVRSEGRLKSSKQGRPSEAQIEADMDAIKRKSRPSASDDFVCGSGAAKVRYKAVVASVGRVTSFSFMEVEVQSLNDADLVSVLEFLPPQGLRQMAAVSWHVRECVSRLAPPHFFTSPRSISSAEGPTSMPWFPNYLFAADVSNNPWIVHDAAPSASESKDHTGALGAAPLTVKTSAREDQVGVVWRMIFDGISGDEEEYALVDSSDNRVVTVSLEVQGGSASRFQATVMYGGGRKRQNVSKISESWNPFSKTTTWKLNNGRRLGIVSISNSEVSVQADAMPSDTPMITMRRASTTEPSTPSSSTLVTAKGTPALPNSTSVLHFYSSGPGAAAASPQVRPCAELKYSRSQRLGTTRKGDVVAELTLHHGCDAFVTSVLAVYGRVKWSAASARM